MTFHFNWKKQPIRNIHLDESEFLPREAFRDGRERDETEDDGGAEPDNSGQKVSVVQQSLLLLSRLDRYLLFQDL